MKHRIWFKALALVAVLSIVATACADDSGGGDGGTGAGEVDCATVEFGCVEVGADEPINLGAAQVISGADASLDGTTLSSRDANIRHSGSLFSIEAIKVIGPLGLLCPLYI